MADRTGIEWTDATWNVCTGCTKVSQGCKHCYAETVAERFWAKQYRPVLTHSGKSLDTISTSHHEDYIANGFARPRRFTDVQCHEDRLDAPLHWRKPRMVFVNSMSDLFHEAVPDAFIDRVFAVMALTPQHTFQVLTKRPERMRDYFLRQDQKGFSRESNLNGAIWSALGTPRGSKIHHGGHWRRTLPLPNVWLGVSCEDQATADERIPLLLQTPAAVRFVSCEPLLGPIDLNPWLLSEHGRRHIGAAPGLSWVIVGGESGPKARPCDVEWIRSLVQQCRAAGVPVFVKQLGGYVQDRNDAGFDGDPGDNWTPETRYEELTSQGWQGDPVRIRLRVRKGGDPSEWPEDLRVREWPDMATKDAATSRD